MKLHRPYPSLIGGPGHVVRLTPEDASWTWTGLQVVRVGPGLAPTVETGDSECFVLPLAGSVSLEVTSPDGVETFDLAGRSSVFTGPSDFVYVGRDSRISLTSATAAEIAVPAARCHTRRPARYGAADQVPVETRGAGRAARQVVNFGVPGVWEHAEKLICCEVLTPSGNWSSYPPHKHDASAPCPVVNEEIYYYRIGSQDQVTPSRAGFGYHRTYTGPEHAAVGLPSLDELIEVRDHDVVLVPHGYHGPCSAAPATRCTT